MQIALQNKTSIPRRLTIKTLSYIFFILLSSASQLTLAQGFDSTILQSCSQCAEKSQHSTATVILDKGETALLSRAWLTANSQKSIDVQYFIWSNDNVGILASVSLLKAAEKGIKVRVIIDDFLVEADNKTLLSLAAHPNIDIKIYNPLHKTGVSKWKRLVNIATRFRDANQRMHDKVAIFDQQIAITGGRNMADEYFDFDRKYSFRDRDILVYGKSVKTMQYNFELFWNHPLTQPITELLDKSLRSLSPQDIARNYKNLIEYGDNEENFSAEVKNSIQELPKRFQLVAQEASWSNATFIHDIPGKNDGNSGLKGGGNTTAEIVKLLKNAKKEILIQSPYLVLPKEGFILLEKLIAQGVEIKISTNSLASTDNLMAFSGYHKMRKKLLQSGIQLFEYKPAPANQAVLHQRYLQHKSTQPVFAIHAKSMVIDGNTALIGSFNLDPRSIHLNTEVAMVIPDALKAKELRTLILDDMKPENSWHIELNKGINQNIPLLKKFKLLFFKLLPIEAIL